MQIRSTASVCSSSSEEGSAVVLAVACRHRVGVPVSLVIVVCVVQVCSFWKTLQWPDPEEAVTFLQIMTEVHSSGWGRGGAGRSMGYIQCVHVCIHLCMHMFTTSYCF